MSSASGGFKPLHQIELLMPNALGGDPDCRINNCTVEEISRSRLDARYDLCDALTRDDIMYDKYAICAGSRDSSCRKALRSLARSS